MTKLYDMHVDRDWMSPLVETSCFGGFPVRRDLVEANKREVVKGEREGEGEGDW